jgi:hypothetical protein
MRWWPRRKDIDMTRVPSKPHNLKAEREVSKKSRREGKIRKKQERVAAKSVLARAGK